VASGSTSCYPSARVCCNIKSPSSPAIPRTRGGAREARCCPAFEAASAAEGAKICAKCHRERPSGRDYHFFYGTKGPSTTYSSIDKMQKVTSTPYKVAGQAVAWICDACVRRRKVLYLAVMFLCAAMFVAGAVGSALEKNTANLFACSGIAFFAVAGGLFQVLTGREEFGEKAAISAKRKDLSAEGHNALLTPRQVETMRRRAA
jgi:uncharacterized membrane protein